MNNSLRVSTSITPPQVAATEKQEKDYIELEKHQSMKAPTVQSKMMTSECSLAVRKHCRNGSGPEMPKIAGCDAQ